MAPDSIQADYTQLEQISLRFGSAREQTSAVRDQIMQASGPLIDGGWQGRGAQTFADEVQNDVVPAIDRLITALDAAQAVTSELSSLFRAAETEAAALFAADSSLVPGARPSQGFFWDMLNGMGAELSDMWEGIKLLFTDPGKVLDGLGYAITNPGALLDAFIKPYREAIEQGRPGEAVGRGIIALGSMLLGTKGADKALKVIRGGEAVAEVGETAATVGRTADIAETAATTGRAADEIAETATTAGRTSDEIAETATTAERAVETTNSGATAVAKGAAREQHVADLVGGKVTAGEKVVAKGIGSTDIDVVGPNGELIAVGGPAKAKDLGKLGKQIQVTQAIGAERGVPVYFYFEEGTPEAALALARRKLGDEFVKTFPPPPAP